SAQAPLVLAGENKGIRLMCIAFDLYATDWPLQVSFPVFMANAVDWLLVAGQGGLTASSHQTGDTIMIPTDTPLEIRGPQGDRWELGPAGEGVVYFNRTHTAGLYEARMGEEGAEHRTLPINLLSI